MSRLLAIAIWLISSVAAAQVPVSGAGFGTGQKPAYTGPGDVITSGWVQWSGFNCFKASYSGNAWKITDSNTTHTDTVSCSAGVLSSTPDSMATITSDCASASGFTCNLGELYDQSGANSCSGSTACNYVFSSTVPTAVSNCTGLTGTYTWCMKVTSSTTETTATASWSSDVSQPYTIIAVFDPSAITGGDNVLVFNASGAQFGYTSAAGAHGQCSAGTQLNVGSITAGTWYDMGCLMAASSLGAYNLNGSVSTGKNFGANTLSPTNLTAAIGGQTGDTQFIAEFGILNVGTTGNLGTYHTNVSARLGTP